MVNIINMLWATITFVFGVVISVIVMTIIEVFVSSAILSGLNSILVQFAGWAFAIFMVFILPILVATDDDQKIIGGMKSLIGKK